MKTLERYGPPALFVLISVGLAYFFGDIATERTLTSLESVVWQSLSLLIGLTGSFLFGRQSAQVAAREIVRPSARSAFRRLVSLYLSISKVARIIESSRTKESLDEYKVVLAELKGIVFWQLATADNSLEDWRDIVREDVEELYEKISADDTTGDRQ